MVFRKKIESLASSFYLDEDKSMISVLDHIKDLLEAVTREVMRSETGNTTDDNEQK